MKKEDKFAAGLDDSRVMHQDFEVPIKSIGHGVTCTEDLVNSEEVRKVMLMLTQDIGHKLRVNDFNAGGVQIAVRDNSLAWRQYQAPLEVPTQLLMDIARGAHALFDRNYDWKLPVRSVTVRAIKLIPKTQPVQTILFDDPVRREKMERLEEAVEEIRERFGKNAIYSACLMGHKQPLCSTSN